MKNKFLTSGLIIGGSFVAAIILALMAQFVRQSPPQGADSGWRYQVAVALDQAGDLHHAVQELQTALNDPESENDARMLLEAIESRKQKAQEAALDLETKKQVGMGVMLRGKITFQEGIVAEIMGDDQKALAFYEESIQIKPNKSLPYVRLGLLYERLGAFKKAEENFRKAVEKDESAHLTNFHFGLFLARSLKDNEEALRFAEKLEKARPIYAKIIREKIKTQ